MIVLSRYPLLLNTLMISIIVTSCKKSDDPVISAAMSGFTYTSQGSFPINATFINTSAGNYVQFEWNFGDGSSSTVLNPVHLYHTPGTYVARLIATASTGVRDTAITNITIPAVLAGPAGTSGRNAAFVYNLYWSAPYSVTYTNTSTNAVSYVWDFGDGSTSVSAASPFNHTYPMPGTYQVELRSTGTSGSDTARAIIIFN